MGEKQQFWHIMLYYSKKDKNATEMQEKKIFSVYGEGAETDWTCQKWFVKFCAREFLLDNALQSADQLKLIAIKLKY